MFITKDLSSHDLHWENLYFGVAPPHHIFLRKTFIIYLKMKPVLLIYVISNHQDFQEMFKCSFMYVCPKRY